MQQPLAHIHPDAKIDETVAIEPFVTIAKNVEIGAGTYIGSNVTILEGTRIGENCRIFPGAVIGAIPQDLKFRGEDTLAIIGDNTTLREYVTVNRGTAAKGKTVVGSNCLIMAYCHIAHDCIIGDNVIMSNATQLAGEIQVDDYAILSGGILAHQFTRIGAHVMLQGGSKVTKDIPPYIMAGREPLAYAGLNLIGLRRRGYSNEQINAMQDIYRIIYNTGLNTTQAIERIEAELPETPERTEILTFIKNSTRGIIRGILETGV
ncbi:MAG: acyl-ACP--UDP-N-acetylglucosamine O-acyltransferase [Paludibacter sp.]|jgi:UDP-N-acetylglucosamine acyltransferase|nr:acyl-ACP--UDP-N-acetylglucosamine O-acyltransferase [Paludibacter sp.]